MSGFTDVGGRQTFLPPYVSERFGKPPYWACTWVAGLLAVYVASLQTSAPTVAQVVGLANDSGDDDLLSGSTSGFLAIALKKRYGLTVHRENVSNIEAQRRLSTGWVLVAGCWYGKLPVHYRRWSPRFTGGHRMLLAGWSAGRTRVFDPMADMPSTYEGEWLAWSDFTPAFWSDDQVWVLEGELMQQIITIVVDLAAAPRPFAIPAGATIQAYTAIGPGKKGTFPTGSKASFDAVVHIAQLPDPKRVPHGGGIVRVKDGLFAGQYIAASALRNPDGSALNISPPVAPAPPPVDTAAIARAAALTEYDRVTKGAVLTPASVVVTPAKVAYPARPL